MIDCDMALEPKLMKNLLVVVLLTRPYVLLQYKIEDICKLKYTIQKHMWCFCVSASLCIVTLRGYMVLL